MTGAVATALKVPTRTAFVAAPVGKMPLPANCVFALETMIFGFMIAVPAAVA